jgi:hypothetical protein
LTAIDDPISDLDLNSPEVFNVDASRKPAG